MKEEEYRNVTRKEVVELEQNYSRNEIKYFNKDVKTIRLAFFL